MLEDFSQWATLGANLNQTPKGGMTSAVVRPFEMTILGLRFGRARTATRLIRSLIET